MHDYGARFYDPQRGQFLTVDPLAESYQFQTPYAYAANDPIKYKDIQGMGPGDDNDRSGFIQNASNEQRDLTPVTALVVDATAWVLNNLTPFGAIDDAIVAYNNPQATTSDKVNATVNAAASCLIIKGEKTSFGEKVAPVTGEKTFQTYIKEAKDPSTHGNYSGKTSGKGTPEQNVAKRDQNHHMDETHGPAKLDKSSKNSDAIRGREQQNIVNKGGAKSTGGKSGNAINGVSPNNPKKQQYENAANKEFGTGN